MPKNLKPSQPDIELRPDGWDRFQNAVQAAAKSGPKHRATKPAQSKPKADGESKGG